jgi:orotate phosphoribosyltransferase
VARVDLKRAEAEGPREQPRNADPVLRATPHPQSGEGRWALVGAATPRIANAILSPDMPLDSDAVLDLFRRSGALLEGHFKLTSGLHSERYLQSALVLQYPDLAEALGRELGARTAHLQPTAVLSPALGGIVIGQEVARALGVRALFVERQEGALTLRRGFTLSDADRVLVVEDVLTTGGSTRETAAVAQAHGAQVVGAAVIVDRGADPARLNLPLQALVKLEVPTYAPDVCPLCAKNVPVVKPGSRV